MHINMKELKANFLGIQHFAMQVHKTTVVHADNTTALAYIKHQGGTHSFSLCEVVKNLLCWADLNQTRLVIRFIQGKCSVLADELSYHQQILPSEWTLEFSVCTSLWKLWGQPSIDLFAPSRNYCLPLSCSPFPDPLAWATDAMTLDLSNLDLYTFPPFRMILAVIRKFHLHHNVRMTLVAPF